MVACTQDFRVISALGGVAKDVSAEGWDDKAVCLAGSTRLKLASSISPLQVGMALLPATDDM